MDGYAFVPVTRGYWRHHELLDETYVLDDFFDIMEVIAVIDENERRRQEQEELERQLQAGR